MLASGIRPITARETVPIRLAILRPGLPPESASFPGDAAPATRHFGAFERGELIGVASIYLASMPEEPEAANVWQLRGMATVPEVRGRGWGGALVDAAISAAAIEGGQLLWCNARARAVGFYLKHGFHIASEEFDIPTAGPHFQMWTKLDAQAVVGA